VSIVTDGHGLNITLASYLDRFDFGFIVDRELVPDVWDLADMYIAEIGRLSDTSGAEWAPASATRCPAPRPNQACPDGRHANGDDVDLDDRFWCPTVGISLLAKPTTACLLARRTRGWGWRGG
jgi:hypothetical protein